MPVFVWQVEPEDRVCVVPSPTETVPDQYLHQCGHECEGGGIVL